MAQNIHILLLDGAQGLIIIPILFLIHVISTLIIEGFVLYLFNYKKLKSCFLDAFIVNLCSLIIGLLLIIPFHSLVEYLNYPKTDDNLIYLMLLYYIQTVIVEGISLKLLNKKFPTSKVILVTIVMNIITYFTLYIVLRYMNL